MLNWFQHNINIIPLCETSRFAALFCRLCRHMEDPEKKTRFKAMKTVLVLKSKYTSLIHQ